MSKSNEQGGWIHHFEVCSPTKHKQGFTVYQVISKVYRRNSPEACTKISVWKRYNDFKKLYTELSLIHRQLYLKGEFPKFPKSKVFGRFDYDVVEERRKSAYSLLAFSSLHPQLYLNKAFLNFFETGYEINDLVEQKTDDCYKDEEELQPPLVPERLWKNSEAENETQSLDQKTNSHSTSESLSSDSILSSNVLYQDEGVSSTQPEITTSVSELNIGNSPEIVQNSSGDHVDCVGSEEISGVKGESSGGNSLPGSKSCSSLDSVSRKENGRIWRKKKNGPSFAGFFDFLPAFPNRRTEGKVREEKVLTEALSSSYVCEAAGHFAVAQHHEANGNFANAFSSYKEGIAILLSGAQNDGDTKRKLLVRKKLEKYLKRAETMNYIQCDAEDPIDEIFSNPAYEELSPRLVNSSIQPSPSHELKDYKVVRIHFNKVLIVVNGKLQDGTKCYALKVLRKSVSPMDPSKETFVSPHIPFMVKMLKCFETESSIVLLLQYAGGGRLKDFVDSYQRKYIGKLYSPDSSQNYPESDKPEEMESKKYDNQKLSEIVMGEKSGDDVECSNFISPIFPPDFPNSSNGPINNFPSTQVESDNVNELKEPSAQFNNSEKVIELNDEKVLHIKSNQETKKFQEIESGKAIVGYLDAEAEKLIVDSKDLLRTVELTLEQDEARSLIVKLSESEESEESGLNTREFGNREESEDKRAEVPRGGVCEGAEGPGSLCPPGGQRIVRETNEFPPGSRTDINSKSIPSFVRNGNGMSMSEYQLLSSTFERDLPGPFSPGSEEPGDLENPPLRIVPECCVKVWAAEIVIALEFLHSYGLIFGDLEMRNVLLGDNGHVLLSFRNGQWAEVDEVCRQSDRFLAPETQSCLGKAFSGIHPSADWWSLGSILFQLLTGQPIELSHPQGILQQTVLKIPHQNLCGDSISPEAISILTELLEYSPTQRLGYFGATEVKGHPFFYGFDWDAALKSQEPIEQK